METKICGAPHPDEKMIRCAIHAGHGRVRDKEDPSSEWYEHASPAHGAWWNVEPEPEVVVPRSILASDVSIPRQDGQPWGVNYPRQIETEVETWYGVFNDPVTLLPKFESGEIHSGLRETLLDTPIFESRNLGDVLRHAQLTWEDREVQHRDKVRVAEAQLLAPTRVVDGKLVRITPEVPPPTPVVIKTQTVTRTGWAIVSPDVLKKAVGGPAIRDVSM